MLERPLGFLGRHSSDTHLLGKAALERDDVDSDNLFLLRNWLLKEKKSDLSLEVFFLTDLFI